MHHRRVPQGTRGLKSRRYRKGRILAVSRPARDAWVEIAMSFAYRSARLSRPARDAWVEILKGCGCNRAKRSRPARDAWVEMSALLELIKKNLGRVPQGTRGLKSLNPFLPPVLFSRVPQGTRGLKLICHVYHLLANLSRPARDAWVEMRSSTAIFTATPVASRKGRVG